MCGIFGVASATSLNKDQRQFVLQSTFCGSLRGMDSTGLALVDKNDDINIYKRALAGPDFLCSSTGQAAEKDLDKSFVVIGHNRAATNGTVNDNNAHPFEYPNLVGVHNGTLWMRTDLPKHGNPVDSMDILESLDSVTGDDNLKSYANVLTKVSGSYSLVWYVPEQSKLYFARNDERPMFFIRTDTSLMWASEGGMLNWLANRCDLMDLKERPVCRPTKELTVYEYDCNNMALTGEQKYEKKRYSYSSDSYRGSSGRYNRTTGAGNRTNLNNSSNGVYTDRRSGDRVRFYSYDNAIKKKLWCDKDQEVIFIPDQIITSGTNIPYSKVQMEGIAITHDQQHLRCTVSRAPSEKKGVSYLGKVWVVKTTGITVSDTVTGLFHCVHCDGDGIEAMFQGGKSKNDTTFIQKIEDQKLYVDPKELYEIWREGEKRKRDKKGKGRHLVPVDTPNTTNTGNSTGQSDDYLNDRTVQGPHGMISPNEWFGITEPGCSECGMEIGIEEAETMAWDEKGQPICSTCFSETMAEWAELTTDRRNAEGILT